MGLCQAGFFLCQSWSTRFNSTSDTRDVIPTPRHGKYNNWCSHLTTQSTLLSLIPDIAPVCWFHDWLCATSSMCLIKQSRWLTVRCLAVYNTQFLNETETPDLKPVLQKYNKTVIFSLCEMPRNSVRYTIEMCSFVFDLKIFNQCFM